MNRGRTEDNWKQLTGDLKRRWVRLIDGQIDLWAGKRDQAKPVARRHASTEKLNDANRGDQS
jgi:uncharacterized protein YjbJ (UPF0337 family)